MFFVQFIHEDFHQCL